jgi:putative nucleotidyltransferase with HDIG domain
MIPTPDEARKLWVAHHLPEYKKRHSQLVADLAEYFSREFEEKGIPIRTDLLLAGALLHDIDKNIPHKNGEVHPDTGVRILREAGMDEVAGLVATHPLHAILDPTIAPKSWEEKLLFLVDKMVKQEIISVDERFSSWQKESLLKNEQEILDKSYPEVKKLEDGIMTVLTKSPADVIKSCKESIMKKGGSV